MTLKILFVGLQQIGTSLAMALSETGVDATIVGHDPNKLAAQAAEAADAVHELTSNPYKAARSADVVVVTLPAAEADEYLADAADQFAQDALLLDGSPLKASTLRWAKEELANAHYVGMVPVVQYQALFNLDGSYQGARADLFEDGLLGLVIPAETPERAINIAVNIAETIGSKPFFIDPAEMEAVTTLTDTLPALLSLALIQIAASSRGWPDIQRIAGQGFMAATHNLAETEAGSLTGKLLENKDSLLVHLDQFINQLQELRGAIDEGEEQGLTKAIERAINERRAWLAKRERADWEGDELGRSQVSSTGMLGNLFGFDPSKGRR